MARAPVVLVTRPEADAARTIRAVEAQGLTALAWPLTRIVPIGGPVAVPDDAGAILFTSSNGVRAFAGASSRRDLPVLCVGDRTAAEARAAGFADVRSAGGDARDLARLAADAGIGRMLLVRGRDAARDLAADLRSGDVAVDEAILYAAEEVDDLPPAVADLLGAGEPAILTVWSPRNGAILARRLAANPSWHCARLGAVAISERAAAALDGTGCATISTAERPDGPAMIAAISALAERMRR
jgi:uroporphyrinogen-III synthase